MRGHTNDNHPIFVIMIVLLILGVGSMVISIALEGTSYAEIRSASRIVSLSAFVLLMFCGLALGFVTKKK